MKTFSAFSHSSVRLHPLGHSRQSKFSIFTIPKVSFRHIDENSLQDNVLFIMRFLKENVLPIKMLSLLSAQSGVCLGRCRFRKRI
jgi:hypothetical protein